MGVKEDAKLNETLKQSGVGNSIPNGGYINPREVGLAGVRMVLDQVLSGVDGLGQEQIDALGVTVKEIAENRVEIEKALLSIIRNDYRRPQRRQAVAAAMRVAGHLGMKAISPALITALEAQHLPPTLRATAADALGLMRAEDVENTLLKYLDDSHETVVRSVAVALGKVGSALCVEELKRRALSVENLALKRSLHIAVSRIEQRGGLPPSLEQWSKPLRIERGQTRSVMIYLDAEGRVSRKPSLEN
jgi:hypothetical protein